MEIFNLVVLVLSGALLVFAGTMRLVKPIKSFCVQTYAERHANDFAEDADMRSEMRGEGAATLFAGLTVLAGAVLPGMRPTSFAVGIVFFGGFALGRAVSFAVDGKPNKDLVNGLVSELLFGGLHVVSLALILT